VSSTADLGGSANGFSVFAPDEEERWVFGEQVCDRPAPPAAWIRRAHGSSSEATSCPASRRFRH